MTDDASSAFAAFERNGWEAAASEFTERWTQLTNQAISPLLDAVHATSEARVLDVACGPGWLSAAATGCGARSVGVDFAWAMVAEAHRRNPNVAVCQGDAECLPFASERFDAVAMNFGLLHLAQPDTALREAHRVLRVGGRLGFTVWATPDQALGFQIILRAVDALGKIDVGLPAGPPFFRFSTADESTRTLLHLGFEAPSIRTLPLVWQIPSAEHFFDAMRQGTVRTRGLLAGQTPTALAAIRASVIDGARSHQHGDTIEIPMPAVLVSAVKAA